MTHGSLLTTGKCYLIMMMMIMIMSKKIKLPLVCHSD